jgi:hypothetical protein
LRPIHGGRTCFTAGCEAQWSEAGEHREGEKALRGPSTLEGYTDHIVESGPLARFEKHRFKNRFSSALSNGFSG